ncbi:hypothetical protein ACKX2D_04565 [Lachnospiraceae bacterium YH-ros2226]
MSLGIAGYLNAEYNLNKVQKKENDEAKKSNGRFALQLKEGQKGTTPSDPKDVYIRSDSDKKGDLSNLNQVHTQNSTKGNPIGEAKNEETSDIRAFESNSNRKNQTIAADVNNTSARDVMKMTASERADLVSRLEEEQKAAQQQFIQMVRKSLGYQASAYENANAQPSVDNNGIWHFLASGNYTVDAATKAEAEASISEDGYFGIQNTAQRLFDFAAALVGDDADKMKTMQEGIARGFKEAEEAWGKELPEICQKTLEKTNQMFQDYYDSKTKSSDQEATL